MNFDMSGIAPVDQTHMQDTSAINPEMGKYIPSNIICAMT
jgi:hypothetical protein